MEKYIYVLVVFNLDEDNKPIEKHNNGWFSKLKDAEEYMDFAGQEAEEGGHYDEPFEYRWNYVMIEKVSEGPCNHTEIVASYKAEWYEDPEFKYDKSKTEIVNRFRKTRVRAVKLDEPPFDTSGVCGFSEI